MGAVVRSRQGLGLLLLAGAQLLTTGCRWWQREPSPVPAPMTRAEPLLPRTDPPDALPSPVAPPANTTRPLSRMPDNAQPVLEMRKDPASPHYLVSLRAESGLPLLEPGATLADFDAAVERLGAVVVERSSTRIEVAPGGTYEGLELPLRVWFEFDADGRFVRTMGDF